MGYEIMTGDVLDQLATLPDQSVQTCITSPPYWGLRDYGVHGQRGLETTPEEYTKGMVEVFRGVQRVLRNDGTLWLNLGDSYAAGGQNSGSSPEALTEKQRSNAGCRYERRVAPPGLKPKDLVGIPWRIAFALQANGWYLRSDIIWHKPNPMPESVRDRPTRSHEYMFLLTKSEKYYYDHEAVKEDAVSDPKSGNGFKRDARLSYKDENGARGNDEQWDQVGGKRNRRDVWSINTQPFKGAHFAVFPEKLVEPCVLAGSKPDSTVLDPFCGSGTVGVVSQHYGRNFVGIELNPEYVEIAHKRITAGSKKLGQGSV